MKYQKIGESGEKKKEEEKEEKKKRKKRRVRMVGRRDRGVWEQTAKGTENGGHGKRGVGRIRRGRVKAYGRKKRGEDWRGMGKKWDDENVDASWP